MSDDMMALAIRVQNLGEYLELWATRDDSEPQAGVRAAAGDALGTIDCLVGELHRLRAELVDEILRSDDVAMARTAVLVAESRARRAPSE